MFPNAKLIRITPDAPGQGGMKTSVHSHQARPLLDTYNCYNVYVVNGRWRKAFDPVAAGTDHADQTKTYAVHVFYEYSTSDPTAAPTVTLLAHDYNSGTSTHSIWNSTTGTVLKSIASPSLPANFLNIKGRCFVGWGSEPGFITDGSTVYSIGIAAPVTAPTYTLSGASGYSVWSAVDSPYVSIIAPSPAWSSGDVGKTIVVNGTRFQVTAYTATWAAPGGTLTNLAGAAVATINAAWPPNQAYGGLDITVGGEDVLVGSYTVTGSTTTITLQAPLIGANMGAAYTLSGSRFTLSANSIFTSWVADATVYRGALTWTGAGPQYGYAYVDPLTGHVSNLSPIETVTQNDQAGVDIVLANIDESDNPRAYATRIFRSLLSGGPPCVQLTGGPGQPSDLGYIYYGYFTNGSSTVLSHPLASGTVSVVNGSASIAWATGTHFDASWVGDTITINGSPHTVGSVTSNILLTITGTIGDATGTYPFSSQDSPLRYNLDLTGRTAHIDYVPFIGFALTVQSSAAVVQFTIASGNTLGITLNTTWGGTSGYYYFTFDAPLTGLTFTDVYPNSYLNPLIEGPVDTNGEPEVNDVDAWPAHMAYWDSRLWINPTQAPSFLIYSADSAQAPVGVPEECFPLQNALVIPAADGRVVGLKVIGSILIITTERFAYYVAGFNETNYRLVRFATTMYGVGDYQMAELPADTGDSSNVVYLGRDKKLYVLAPGQGAVSLSEAISDQVTTGVTTVASYQECRVHVVHIEQRRLIILRIPGQCLVYDLERKTWTQLTPGSTVPEAFATLYGQATTVSGNNPVTELYGRSGVLKSWLLEGGTASTSATISTFSSGFTDVKGKKRLNFVRLYVTANNPTYPWIITVAVDDKTGVDYLFTVPALTYTATVESGPPVQTNSDNIYTLYPTNSTPIDGSNCKELIAFMPNAIQALGQAGQAALDAPMEGFRFYVTVNYPGDTVSRDLLAMDLCVTEIQNSREAAP